MCAHTHTHTPLKIKNLTPQVKNNDAQKTTYTDSMVKILTSVLNNDRFSLTFRTNKSILETFRQNKHMPLENKTGMQRLKLYLYWSKVEAFP